VSNWLSEPSQFQNSYSHTSHPYSPIKIGKSTKSEIVSRLGNPTDRQLHSIDGLPFESLSYSTTETEIKSYQYIPFLGALAFWGPQISQTPSAAISFNSEDIVSGLTVSTVNAYGDIRFPEILPIGDSPPAFYGMRNPDVFHTPADSNPKSS
jgi:hypothetical protein